MHSFWSRPRFLRLDLPERAFAPAEFRFGVFAERSAATDAGDTILSNRYCQTDEVFASGTLQPFWKWRHSRTGWIETVYA